MKKERARGRRLKEGSKKNKLERKRKQRQGQGATMKCKKSREGTEVEQIE